MLWSFVYINEGDESINIAVSLNSLNSWVTFKISDPSFKIIFNDLPADNQIRFFFAISSKELAKPPELQKKSD